MNRRQASRGRMAGHTQPGWWRAATTVLAGWLLGFNRQLRLGMRPADPERGDVPGWVMITLMSAILVAALLFIAEPALKGMFQDAIKQVQP